MRVTCSCPSCAVSVCLCVCRSAQVFLSATLSNANEFSEWVAYLHKQPCHVVYTDYRPTPLEHFVSPIGGQGMYKVGWGFSWGCVLPHVH